MQSIGKIARPNADTRQRQRALRRHHGFQCLARHELHHQVGRAVFVRSQIVDGNDIGMREPPQYLRFAHELLLQFLGAESVPERFHRHSPVDEGVVRFINAAGGADPNRAYDLIACLCHVVGRDSSPRRRQRDRPQAAAKWALSPEKPEDGSTGKFFPTPFFRHSFAGLQDSNRRGRNVYFSRDPGSLLK